MEASNRGFGKAGARWNEDVCLQMIDRGCGLGDGVAIIVSPGLVLPVGGRAREYRGAREDSALCNRDATMG